MAAYLQLSGQLLALQRQQPRLLASLQTRQWQQQAEQKKQPILAQLTSLRLRAKSNH